MKIVGYHENSDGLYSISYEDMDGLIRRDLIAKRDSSGTFVFRPMYWFGRSGAREFVLPTDLGASRHRAAAEGFEKYLTMKALA